MPRYTLRAEFVPLLLAFYMLPNLACSRGETTVIPVKKSSGNNAQATGENDVGSEEDLDRTQFNADDDAIEPTNSGTPTKLTPLPALALDAIGNATFTVATYGSSLQANKTALSKAIDAAKPKDAQEKAVVIAIAMYATAHMSGTERSSAKDGTVSATCSILNLNFDMLSRLGYAGQDFGAALNAPEKLPEVVTYLFNGFRQWGFDKTLNFIQGGFTAYQDGTSFGAPAYRNAILSIYKQIAKDPSLATDGRRVEITSSGS